VPEPDNHTAGLTVQQADALWDAVAIPGPHTPTFTEQHERVCRAVAGILAELPTAAAPPTGQTADRDRIELAIHSELTEYRLGRDTGMIVQRLTDAVLRLLPPSGDQAAETEQLRQVAPALSTDRIWQVQVQRRNGSWIDHSPPTINGSEAMADYEKTVASTGHLWSYRLICTDRTHTITAQHNRPEEA
jgi:hypothetical protein